MDIRAIIERADARADMSKCVAPSPAVSYATPGSLIKSEASAAAVSDKTPVPVSEYVTSAVGASPAPVNDYASTSSMATACAAPGKHMSVRDIMARSDALAAQDLKREACHATRAPVIEHVKTSPAGATASVKPMDRLLLNGKLPIVCSTCTDQQCYDLFLNIVGLLV